MSVSDELFEAIQQGNRESVVALLKTDPSLAEATHESGVSALMLALYYQRPDIASEIAGARRSFSAWELAALGRTADLAAALDADPDALETPAADGFRLLGLSSFFGHESTVELLLDRGADAGQPANNPTAVTALHSAVAFRDPEVAVANARRLLAGGAPVDATQQGGWTALHAAALHGNEALVRLLLEHGACSTLATAQGKTAATLAHEGGYLELVELLSD